MTAESAARTSTAAEYKQITSDTAVQCTIHHNNISNKRKSNLAMAALNALQMLLAQNSLTLATPEIYGGSQNTKVGHLTLPRHAMT